MSWYEQTLQALAATHHDAGRQASVHLALGEARVRCGDRTGARETFLQAAALARSASVPTVLAGAALGLGSGRAGFEVGLLDQQQLDLLEEASSAFIEKFRPSWFVIEADRHGQPVSNYPDGGGIYKPTHR